MTEFYYNAMDFFELVKRVLYAVSICFAAVFGGIYIVVFVRFIRGLNEEIWNARGVLNMIPIFILENNPAVREQVWRCKCAK